MADKLDIDLTGTAAEPATDAQAELKRKLAKRMGFAVVLIAVLLAALAVFDQLSKPELIEPPAARPPVPLPRQEVSKALKPPAPLDSGSAAAGSEAAAVVVEKTSAALSAPTSPASPETPPKPEVQAQPAVPAARTAPAAPVAEGSGAPMTEAPSPPPAPTPAPAARPAAPSPVPAAAPRLFSGYMLQAGVFSSAQRAEELHAKLQLNGIPSTMEARVQVGPFKTREEADATRDKLKSLGIETVLISPKGARR